ncbi:hypothetical protein HK098_001112 [Nowakowskiella sp. JEL0407]|nr:hypothetical protein HK098_001112 [Nowakowskiella sp. JEL0407]
MQRLVVDIDADASVHCDSSDPVTLYLLAKNEWLLPNAVSDDPDDEKDPDASRALVAELFQLAIDKFASSLTPSPNATAAATNDQHVKKKKVGRILPPWLSPDAATPDESSNLLLSDLDSVKLAINYAKCLRDFALFLKLSENVEKSCTVLTQILHFLERTDSEPVNSESTSTLITKKAKLEKSDFKGAAKPSSSSFGNKATNDFSEPSVITSSSVGKKAKKRKLPDPSTSTSTPTNWKSPLIPECKFEFGISLLSSLSLKIYAPLHPTNDDDQNEDDEEDNEMVISKKQLDEEKTGLQRVFDMFSVSGVNNTADEYFKDAVEKLFEFAKLQQKFKNSTLLSETERITQILPTFEKIVVLVGDNEAFSYTRGAALFSISELYSLQESTEKSISTATDAISILQKHKQTLTSDIEKSKTLFLLSQLHILKSTLFDEEEEIMEEFEKGCEMLVEAYELNPDNENIKSQLKTLEMLE